MSGETITVDKSFSIASIGSPAAIYPIKGSSIADKFALTVLSTTSMPLTAPSYLFMIFFLSKA